jgi:hypothetical protein
MTLVQSSSPATTVQRAEMAMKLNISDMSTTDKIENNTSYPIISYSVRFPLLLTFEIPSIICYIIVLSHIFSEKSLRSATHNYVVILILISSFIIVSLVIPWEMDYYRQNKVSIESSTFCMIWWFFDLCSFYTCQILVAWASFERHILVFHHHLFDQKWKKICFHYMPPLILIIYMWIFHIYVIFIFPCDSYIDLKNKQCLFPCYLNDSVFGLWESIFHGVFITICIIVFSCSFLIRVYRSKSHLQESINWWKYRRIIFQLISLSSLYLSIIVPLGIIYIIDRINSSKWASETIECLSFFSYFIPLLLPFICLTTLSEIWTKLRRSINRRANRRIQPMPSHTLPNHDFISVTQV